MSDGPECEPARQIPSDDQICMIIDLEVMVGPVDTVENFVCFVPKSNETLA